MRRKRPPLPIEPQIGRTTQLDSRGRGVVQAGEREVRVAGALAGELVRYRYLRRARRYDEAEVIEVHEPSPLRGEVRCPHFQVCGGCSVQHLSHRRQVLDKERRLQAALAAAGVPAPREQLAPLLSPAYGYRRRARLAVREVPAKGGALVGFREKTGNRVADIGECHVLIPAVGFRVGELRGLVRSLTVRASIPQIEVAAGDRTTALVVRHLEALPEADRRRLEAFARTSGIQIYLQPGGLETVTPLCPARTEPLTYRLEQFQLELEFLPTDFVQVNGVVNRALVAQVVRAADARPGEAVLDLFCGIGNFTLPLARSGAVVTGVDGVEALVARAGANARRNAVGGVRFTVGDLYQPETAARVLAERRFAKLVLDPPRSGAGPMIDALAPPYPSRVVYVSCHPDSLARDAAGLTRRHGFRLVQAGVVDMFPHTSHLEALAVFERARA